MFKRRLLVRLALLGAILWLVQTVQLAVREQRRRELSRRLATALDEYEWKTVAALIRQGADPRTPGSNGSVALPWALEQGDLLIAQRILLATGDDPLYVTRAFTPIPTLAYDPLYGVDDAVRTLERLVRQPGPALPGAWIGLAELRRRLGRYEESIEAYRTTVRLAPGRKEARQGLAQALAASAAACAIRPRLPAGLELMAVAPAETGADPSRWYAAYASVPDQQAEPRIGRVVVALYRRNAEGYRQVGPAVRVGDPRFGEGGRVAGAFPGDLTGDGVPDLAMEVANEGASWAPSSLTLLTVQNGRLKTLLIATGSAPLWLDDLDHNGSYEVRNEYEIGVSMSHALQPRWNDVYAFDGDRYQLANRRFPEAFREWPEILNKSLVDSPGDAEILVYLGRTYEILCREKEARAAYARAEEALRDELQGADGEYEKQCRIRLREVRSRLRALRQDAPDTQP